MLHRGYALAHPRCAVVLPGYRIRVSLILEWPKNEYDENILQKRTRITYGRVELDCALKDKSLERMIIEILRNQLPRSLAHHGPISTNVVHEIAGELAVREGRFASLRSPTLTRAEVAAQIGLDYEHHATQTADATRKISQSSRLSRTSVYVSRWN